MGPENPKYEAVWDLWGVVWLLNETKGRLQNMEHPSLGDVERILDRLNEEYIKLSKEMQKG